MEPAFNKILKRDLDTILPYLENLSSSTAKRSILKARLEEMYAQNYECFGVFLDSKLVGTFGLWFMTRHYAGRSCELDHIYLEQAYRSQGLGKKLFKFVEAYAQSKNCEALELNSYVENFASHKFFMNEAYILRGYHFLKKL
ncbi:GNAT family N-acetyltransferase [Christiangramia salexigens]|uniref:GNAT family N-acetyltransferase n=2 Tax=Christiangramia salexigens TaxID=1913577 RepID=A0A1L3J8G1_9FLAO|nr:GNAT family N-acetyltransferase [Christiangramia salexigens]